MVEAIEATSAGVMAFKFFGRGLVEPHETKDDEAHEQQACKGVLIHYLFFSSLYAIADLIKSRKSGEGESTVEEYSG